MALLQKAYLGSTPLFREEPWWIGTAGTIVDRAGAVADATASASTHTKGAYTELIASTSAECGFIDFQIGSTALTGSSAAQLIDIAVGAAGSEVVVVPDVAVGGIGGNGSNVGIQLPIKIPSGSRVSFRNQAEIASDTCRIFNFTTYAFDAALCPTSLDVLGTDTATSTGTELAGSSGTWTEIVASTSQAYTGFNLIPSTSEANQDSVGEITLEIGVGAAGSEVVLGAIMVQYGNSEFVARSTQFVLIGGNVPAGSRLAVRHNKTSNPEKMDVCLIAIPKV